MNSSGDGAPGHAVPGAGTTDPREAALAVDERMDAWRQDRAEFAPALTHVEWATRWGGGYRALVRTLRREGAHAPPGPELDSSEPRRPTVRRLLDLGCGSGGLSRAVAGAASGPSVRWHPVGLDNHPVVADLAARGGVGGSVTDPAAGPALVRGDARRLPFRDSAFDAALCNLTLHHFGAEDAVTVLSEMRRVTRGLVMVADLERSRGAYLGARLLALTLWRRNRIVRHDGPLSVQRGFTGPELSTLGERAGLDGIRVRRIAPFRFLMTGRGAPAASDPSSPRERLPGDTIEAADRGERR